MADVSGSSLGARLQALGFNPYRNRLVCAVERNPALMTRCMTGEEDEAVKKELQLLLAQLEIPRVTLRSQLARGMLDVEILAGDDTTKPWKLPGMQVQPWQLTYKEVDEYLRDNIGDATMARAITSETPWRPAHCESDTNCWFYKDGLGRANDILCEQSSLCGWTWRLTENGKLSDFIYKDMVTDEEFLPAIGKYWSVLPTASLLECWQDSQHELHNAARSILSQEACYMRDQGALYGAITTFKYTFAIRRPHINSLRFEVTEGYLNTGTEPRVPELLYYLGGMEDRHRQAQKAAATPQKPLHNRQQAPGKQKLAKNRWI